MSYLIFCSFEVGAIPFRMAEIVNRCGVEAYYLYVGEKGTGHDSTQFHYGNRSEKWNLSPLVDVRRPDRARIRSLLREAKEEYKIDHCFATGADAHFLKEVGIPYNYWSFGYDLDTQCNAEFVFRALPSIRRFIRHPLRNLRDLRKALKDFRKARKSIRGADSVMIAPYQRRAITGLCPGKKRFFLPHCLTTVDFETLVQRRKENRESICREIDAEQYFFSSVRQCWGEEYRKMSDNKGNDVILYAFAEYRRMTNDHHSKLVLVRKGQDVGLTEKLSKSLKIDDKIIWVDEMRRDELDRYYQGASICFGQFGTPVLSHSVVEPLANGTPSISYAESDATDVPFYEELPPIFKGKVPEEIANFMSKILGNPAWYREVSFQSWSWVRKNCSEEKFVESFLRIFC